MITSHRKLRNEARVHVEGRAGRSVWARDSRKIWSEHPVPQVAVLKHRLRRVAVREVAGEIGGTAEVEDVLAELESKSHRGAAPATPGSSRRFVPLQRSSRA